MTRSPTKQRERHREEQQGGVGSNGLRARVAHLIAKTRGTRKDSPLRSLEKLATELEKPGLHVLSNFPIRPKVAGLAEEAYAAISPYRASTATTVLASAIKGAITQICVAVDYASEFAATAKQVSADEEFELNRIFRKYIMFCHDLADEAGYTSDGLSLFESIIALYVMNTYNFVIPGLKVNASFDVLARSLLRDRDAAYPPPEAAAPLPLPMGETETIDAFAKRKGLTVAELEKAVDDWVAAKAEATTRGTKGRAKAKPRVETAGDDLNLSPSQVVAVIEDSTLGRLRRRYNELLKSVVVPAEGFKTLKDARAAAKLVTTFSRLRERQTRLGLDPEPDNEWIGEVERARAAFYRSGKHRTAEAG